LSLLAQLFPDRPSVGLFKNAAKKMPLTTGPAAGASVSEEAIVRSRLLFDGDGNGDGRRLNLLLKAVIKWCNQTEDEDSCEDSDSNDVKIHAGLMAQLLHVEWTDAKSKLVQEMNIRETNNYEQILEVIQSKLEEAEKDIVEAKSELDRARIVRRNRMEYDSMAKTIQAFPSRDESGNNIAEATKDLDRLKKEEEELDTKLQLRKKQLYVIVNSIHQLQDMLELEELDEPEERVVQETGNSTTSTNQSSTCSTLLNTSSNMSD